MAARGRGTPDRDRRPLDPAELTSLQIDQAVRAAVSDGRSLYTVDAELIERLKPDVIVTQDLCAVCAVSSGDLRSICPVDARVVSLDPQTLSQVADSVGTLARAVGVAGAERPLVDQMWAAIRGVELAVAGREPKRIFLAEWIDPPFCAGHWLPEMVERAGGRDVIGVAGAPSHTTTWEDVTAHRPELVVVAPCGFDADEAARRAAGLHVWMPRHRRRRRQLLLAAGAEAGRGRAPAGILAPPRGGGRSGATRDRAGGGAAPASHVGPRPIRRVRRARLRGPGCASRDHPPALPHRAGGLSSAAAP